MSMKKTSYIAKPVDANGHVDYTLEENQIWHELYTRQLPVVNKYACDGFIQGLHDLNLPQDHVPQCASVSAVLKEATGWSLAPVPALIPFKQFFHLLANKQFPAATFIRLKEQLDYLEEPDIFHEVFGHAPMLMNPIIAEFTHAYGKLGEHASHKEQVLLAKLYWFTIEFGLMNTTKGLRAYGGGILSSFSETKYCINSTEPLRHPFDIMTVLRTPYRINHIQPIYFIIDNFDIFIELINMDLMECIRQVLGEN